MNQQANPGTALPVFRTLSYTVSHMLMTIAWAGITVPILQIENLPEELPSETWTGKGQINSLGVLRSLCSLPHSLYKAEMCLLWTQLQGAHGLITEENTDPSIYNTCLEKEK